MFLFLAAIQGTNAQELKMHVIDVGTGDAVLLQAEAKNILIDAGPDRNTTAQYLSMKNITDLDLVLVTDPSRDDISGLPEVMNRTRIHEFRDFGDFSINPVYKQIKNRIENESIQYSELIPGEMILVAENITITVLNTPEEKRGGIALLVQDRVTGILLLPDLVPPDLRITSPVQIVRVSDHGSRKANDAGLIHALHPEVAVISTGSDDETAKSTIMEYEAAGAKVLRTDVRGTVLITTDGKRYTTETSRITPSGSISLVSVIETRPPG